MPYPPSFNKTPARIIEIGVGASTCASGSHVCTGKTGTLITKPMRSSRKAQVSRLIPSQTVVAANGEFGNCPTAASAIRLNVCTALSAERIEAISCVAVEGCTTCVAINCSSDSNRTSLVKYSMRIAISISTLPSSV